MSAIGDLAKRLNARRGGNGDSDPDPTAISDEDRRYVNTLHDTSVALPAGAERVLDPANPDLVELRAAYAGLDLPVLVPSRWKREAVESFLDLRYFRGDTLIYWHYRELPRATRLKYFVYMRYVRERDSQGLLSELGEDGAFGCWTFSYPGDGLVSRDLLESVNEIGYLERRLELSRRDRFSVLDIGAGYGRLGHRMSTAYPGLDDYCCVDAIPEATFLCDYYLRHRGSVPPCRTVRLDRLDSELRPGGFDVAVNIHSFSEQTLEAVGWWVDLLAQLDVPWLLVVPNEPDRLLSTEPDGVRHDLAPLLEQAGYFLDHTESVIEDEAVRELIGVEDRFHLFARRG